MTNPIPQTSPHAAYLAQRAAIDEAIAGVLQAGRYIMGPQVAAFEADFAAYIGTKHAIGVASGTDALYLALRANNIGPGDLVATVSNTAVATAAAIELTGARVLFVDVDDETLMMDVAALETLLATQPIRAVIAVHLFGHAAPIDRIAALARQYGALVVEDCAQAHGTLADGRRAGTIGDITAFSFYPTKNLGAVGDGGAIVTNDDATAEAVRLLQQYGWRDRYISAVPGVNSRLDELQAAILRVKLTVLDADNARRRDIAARYTEALRGTSIRPPHQHDGHVYHQYVVRSTRRDALQEALRADGIGTLIHYPVPIHEQPAYAGRVTESLPVTERAAGEILSLPMYPQLAAADVERVCTALARFA